MPQLAFPITADGLSVDVRVNLDGAAIAALHSSGQPVPSSIAARGLIDTGTDISVVAPSILQQMSVQVHAQRKTQAIGGPIQVRLFRVTLFILDASQPHLSWFTLPNLLVMEMPSVLPVDVLIGMDVIRTCKMLVDGTGGHFALEF
jgi:Retroviral aspartyl protease